MFFDVVIKSVLSICKMYVTKFLKLVNVTSKEKLIKENIYLLRTKQRKTKQPKKKKKKRTEITKHINKPKELEEHLSIIAW